RGCQAVLVWPRRTPRKMEHKCQECGSERISPPVALAPAGTPGLIAHLRARVCADCGLTEFHTENALDVYLERTSSAPRAPLAAYRAQPVEPRDAPELYAVVEGLANRAGIPMPRLYVIPDPALNAFATGRSPSHAAVAATEGILRALNRDELEGVLAHELSHVIN